MHYAPSAPPRAPLETPPPTASTGSVFTIETGPEFTIGPTVRHPVTRGLVHRKWGSIAAIGVDEIAWRKSHKYFTLLYQIDEGCKRLLWMARDRTEESLGLFRIFPSSRMNACSVVFLRFETRQNEKGSHIRGLI
jgi:hypothetical protein